VKHTIMFEKIVIKAR